MPAFDFDYRSLVVVLAAGATRRFDAMQYLALAAATGSIEIAPAAKPGSFGPFQLKQVFEATDGAAIGGVVLKNPTGGSLTVTVVTSNKRIGFSDSSSAQSVTIDGITVTVPVSIAATVGVEGKDAHDAAVTAKPLTIGGEALATERAAVTAADAVRAAFDLFGRQLVLPFAHVGDRVGAKVTFAAAGVIDLVPAQAAGFRFHLTNLVVANDGAAANVAIILDGATELFRVAVLPGDSVALSFPVPEHTTAATALRVNMTGATNLRVYARGYKGA